MDFRSIFQSQQRVLELELAVARERFAHYGLRGNAIEIALRDFLEKHIPRALSTGTGEVIASKSDTESKRSGQLDVVISSMSQPFIGNRDVPTTFFIECVHMAGEVKSVLERAMISGELAKARRFRSLQARNLSRLVQVKDADSWASYYVFYRPYFLVTLETKGKWQSILLEIMEFIQENKTIPLDGVFLLDQGVVILLSPHQDYPLSELAGIPFPHLIDGKPATGSIHLHRTDVPLALFLAWIMSFRTSFFQDEFPLAVYVQQMINASMQDAVLYQNTETPEMMIEKIGRLGLFGATLEGLRSAFPRRNVRTT